MLKELPKDFKKETAQGGTLHGCGGLAMRRELLPSARATRGAMNWARPVEKSPRRYIRR